MPEIYLEFISQPLVLNNVSKYVPPSLPSHAFFSPSAPFLISYALVGTMCHAMNIIVIMQFGLEAD